MYRWWFDFFAGVRPGWQRMQSDFPNYWLGSRLMVEQHACDSLYHNDWFFRSPYGNMALQSKASFLRFLRRPPICFAVDSAPTPCGQTRVDGHQSASGSLDHLALWKDFRDEWAGCHRLGVGNGPGTDQQPLPRTGVSPDGSLHAVWVDSIPEGKTIVPGICFGIVAAIKYFPLVMLPEWLLKRRWKLIPDIRTHHHHAGFGFALQSGCTSLSGLPEPGRFRASGRTTGRTITLRDCFPILERAFHRLFLFDAAENPQPWFHAPMLLQLVRHGIPALLLFFGIVHARRLILRNASGAGVAILCLSMLVASPASASYHLLLLLFPMALLLEDETGRSRMSPASTRLSFLLLMESVGRRFSLENS